MDPSAVSIIAAASHEPQLIAATTVVSSWSISDEPLDMA